MYIRGYRIIFQRGYPNDNFVGSGTKAYFRNLLYEFDLISSNFPRGWVGPEDLLRLFRRLQFFCCFFTKLGNKDQ